jgi:HlyD family secretion protein
MRYKLGIVVVCILVVGLIGGGLAWYMMRSGDSKTAFRTATVKEGNLLSTIDSTGTVEPEEQVDVGAQVNGRILSFGLDANGKPIDYRSEVEANMVLAHIDDSLYQIDVATAQAGLVLSRASVEQAKANVVQAKANLLQMQAKCDQAQADWQRAQELAKGSSEALAATTYDAYKYGYDIAKANVAVAEAALAQNNSAVQQAESTVLQAQATLKRAQQNLDYCTIYSPVKGVIIARRVDVGQTVNSGLSAPSLFLIAKDLRRMQVWVAVNEADVGNIYPGQPVTFKTDTFPNQVFRGEVGRVRLNATMTSNVVTYTVEVVTDNSSGTLIPYLTANVSFELAHREKVLMVPNAALRWTPQIDQVAPEYRQEVTEATSRRGGRSQSQAASQSATAPGAQAESGPEAGAGTRPATETGTRPARKSSRNSSAGMLWVVEGKFLRPIKVRVGITDGINTEVWGQDVKEGLEIVIGEQQQAAAGGTVNPFTPQIPRPARSGSANGGGGGGGGSGGGSSGGGR